MSPTDDRSGGKRTDGRRPRRPLGGNRTPSESSGRDAARGGRRQPAGIENATRTPGAPPRTPLPKVERVPKPELPSDEEPHLPKAVLREIRKAVQNDHELAGEVALALSIASEALDLGEPEVALRYASWAKSVVPRSPAIREALGAALYLNEDYAAALTELQAYRRLSGREDQNHLVADCLRALDRDTTRIADLIEAMRASPEVPEERAVEGTIVWASSAADGGDLGAARAILRRHLDELGRVAEPEEHHLRLWYVAGDLAARAGDDRDARRWFEAIAAEDPDAFDVSERLERL